MSLSRSASGPGGLSINTSSANLFGSSSSQPPAPSGLFGATSNAQSTPGSTLFGNASSTPKPSLFNNASSTAATSQPQQSGGLFGSSAATTQPQQAGSGLFGASNTANTQPQQTGGLFQTQPQTQTQTQNTGGIFGSSIAGQTPATGTGAQGGLFGSSANPSQPAANNTGSSFLNQPNQQRPSLFGNTLSQPAQSQANPFAQSQPQSQPQQPGLSLGGSLGLGLTMGQSSTQQTVPGVRIDVSNLKGTTRFNDLQEDLQKQIERVDTFIQQQMRNKEQVDSFMPGHKEMLESVPSDVNFVAKKYESAHSALASAAQSIEAARGLVAQDVDHARLSFRAVDNLKLPEQYHTAGIWSPRQQPAGTANTEADGQDLVGFFSKAADDMEEQVKRYERNMSEIEMHMHGVSDGLVEQLQKMMANKSGVTSGPNEKAQELAIVLRELQQGILKVASDVAVAREGVTHLQLGNFIGNNGDRNGVY
ncbi:hypothetical protein F4818DRAFT_387810 [Hypoxylon cercidicola]|nr:hypothetical protein F4818DRAFT_387810 [Hypoxylon cercidicola]